MTISRITVFLRDYYNEYNRVLITADTSSKASRFFSVILEIVMEKTVILEIVTENKRDYFHRAEHKIITFIFRDYFKNHGFFP